MNNPAVELTGLVKSYGSTTAVDGLDLRMERGCLLA
ncbi:ABC transporter ATP-binding protein, partial [Amycolatopsis sp. PS_44_ISF1]|nr:ABC transporter ATP-binding protein [Amycolatopsis sp. PS_44_ISF1]